MVSTPRSVFSQNERTSAAPGTIADIPTIAMSDGFAGDSPNAAPRTPQRSSCSLAAALRQILEALMRCKDADL